MIGKKMIVKLITLALLITLFSSFFSCSYADGVNEPFEKFMKTASYRFSITDPRITLAESYSEFESEDDTALFLDFMISWVDLYIYEITEKNTSEAFSRAKMIFSSEDNGVAFQVAVAGTDSKTNHINIVFGVQESEESEFEIIWLDYDIAAKQFRGASRSMVPELAGTMFQLECSSIVGYYPNAKRTSFGGVNTADLPDMMAEFLRVALDMGEK